ncbi:MAG: arsenate reductase ArsC [Elusimicrobia bacterium]|nr:arsenate reductase ArsC [Elusimicrobiota bacterium]
MKPRVLFVCVENSCRSQMAEGFARLYGGSKVEVFSAGSHPYGRINETAIAVMKEIGADLGAQRSKGLTDLPPGPFDAVVTMGCGDACPHLPAARRLDWALPDPKRLPLEEFRKVRDEIATRVKALLVELSA